MFDLYFTSAQFAVKYGRDFGGQLRHDGIRIFSNVCRTEPVPAFAYPAVSLPAGQTVLLTNFPLPPCCKN